MAMIGPGGQASLSTLGKANQAIQANRQIRENLANLPNPRSDEWPATHVFPAPRANHN